ncbi:redoxin domain-containing protein [Lutibacter sp.]
MKIKIILTITLSCLLVGCLKHNTEEFTLMGKFKGVNTKQVILSYTNNSNNFINDTILINNGEFSTKGFISGPTIAFLKGNIKKRGTSDPNYTNFFLEPKKIKVSLIEGKFKEAKVTGSTTQKEYEKLKLIVIPLNNEMKEINEKIKEFMANIKKNEDESINDEQIKKLLQKYTNKKNKIKNIRLQFIADNPNSYLSAYFLKFFSKKIPIDTLNELYSNFSAKIQKSKYAVEAINTVKVRQKTMLGRVAPNFTATGLNENQITLESFRGKYVLLDFWAGWCVPCIKGLPELKQLHKNYSLKGLEIIGLSRDNDVESWKKAIDKHNLNIWNHIYDGRENKEGSSIFKKFNIIALPAFILVDKQGVIIGRYLGADYFNDNKLEFNDLEEKLEEIFK